MRKWLKAVWKAEISDEEKLPWCLLAAVLMIGGALLLRFGFR